MFRVLSITIRLLYDLIMSSKLLTAITTFFVRIFVIRRIEKRETGTVKKGAVGIYMRAGSFLLAAGYDTDALRLFQALSRHSNESRILEQLGVVQFLVNEYEEARKTFSRLQSQRELNRELLYGVPKNLTVLDSSWTLAIGHVAHLDVHFKSLLLQEKKNHRSIIFDQTLRGFPEKKILGLYKRYGLEIHSVTNDIDKYAVLGAGQKTQITQNVFDSVTSSFWYGGKTSAETELFGKHGARVYKQWESQKRLPLAVSSKKQAKEARQRLHDIFGLPKDAWFVVFHVREPGYHKLWHKSHPGTRNSDIHTYLKAMDFIISKGGWVIRAGDSSMTPIRSAPQLIDYATSQNNDQSLSIDICEQCSFFVGTNSGFSVIPPIFGKRSVLCNWSPIAIPNWYPYDIFIPKKVRDRKRETFLSAHEMLNNFTGWSQFSRDYDASDLELINNTPEEILDATKEMYDNVFNQGSPLSKNKFLVNKQKKYASLLIEKNSYSGSSLSLSFIAQHKFFI